MSESGIAHLELCNFKSYYGKHIVGPFKSFTCIVGPNGSGKSNITDAITFVLGSATSKQRADSQKDLICSITEENEILSQYVVWAYVEQVYTVSGTETRKFKRSIDVRDSGVVSRFYFNDGLVSRTEYDLQQSQVGFLNMTGSSGPSCLIAQNEVENILNRTPEKFSQYIEGLAGGNEQSVDYQSKMVEIQELENELQNLIHLRSTSWKNRKLASTEADAAQEYEEASDRQSNTVKIRDTLSVAYKEKFLLDAIMELDTSEEKLEKAKVAHLEQTQVLDDVSKVYARSKRKQTQLERERGELQSIKREWERKLHRCETQKAFLEKKKVVLDTKLAEQATLQSDRLRERKIMEKELLDARRKVDNAREELVQNELNRQVEDSYITDYNACMQVLESSGSSKVQEEINEVKKQIAVCKANMSALELRQQGLTGNHLQRNEHVHNLTGRLVDMENRLVHAKKSQSTFEAEFQEASIARADVSKEKEKQEEEFVIVQRQLAQVEGGARTLKRQTKVHAALGGLYSSGDVLGRLGRFIHPIRAEHGVAVKCALQGKFEHVIVRDKTSAARALSTLKEQQAGTVTLVPLNVKIDLPSIDSVRRSLPSHLFMLCDLVKSEECFDNVVLWACGTCVVAPNLDDARDYAFRNNNERGVKVVTLDGAVIHPSGAMSGGGTIIPSKVHVQSNRSNTQKNDKRKRDTVPTSDNNNNNNNTLENEDHGMDGVDLETRKNAILKSLQELNQVSDNSTKLAALQGKVYNAKSTVLSLESNQSVLGAEKIVLEGKLKAVNMDLQTVQTELDKKHTDFSKLTDKQTALESTYMASQKKILVGLAKRMNIDVSSVSSVIRDIQEHRKELGTKVADFERHVNVLESKQALLQKETEIDTSQEESRNQVLEDKAALDVLGKEGTFELNKLKERDTEVSKILALETSHVEKADREKRQAAYMLERAALQVSEQNNRYAVQESSVATKQQEQQEAVSMVVRSAGNIVMCKKRLSKKSRTLDNASKNSDNTEEVNLQALVKDLSVNDICNVYSVSSSEIDTLAELGYKVSTSAALFEMQNQLRTQMNELQAKLETLAPHGDAGVLLDSASERFDAARQALANVNGKQDIAGSELKSIAQHRRSKFDRALASLQKHAGKVFQTVCGGTLLLTPLGDSFIGGVALTVATLGKRARDAVLLSGGEQALVGVALSVGAAAMTRELHGVSEEGPIVVDEIDAAMDAGNVMRVGKLLSLRSKSNGQCVAVSLKETLFSQADALIGVYRDEKGRSQVCTLDLQQYK